MMKTALIGHTGFVGSNLATQYEFTHCFNSKNYQTLQDQSFDLVVCAGVSAVKWWANQNPQQDLANINQLLSVLKTVQAKRFILISTIDVYPRIAEIDERFNCHQHDNHAYGKNRLYVEDSIKALCSDTYIFRLSGLFGKGLKKNVIYDLLNDNCLEIINDQCSFQWYDLASLWADINIAIQHEVRLLNLVNEPIATHDIISRYFADKDYGAKAGAEVHYNLYSCHSDIFAQHSRYIANKATVFTQLDQFIQQARHEA